MSIIDAHHGDRVEEVFYTTYRVVSVFFGKYGEVYFSENGNFEKIGS